MSLKKYRKSYLVSAAAYAAALVFSQPTIAANQQVAVIPGDTMFYVGTGDPIAAEDLAAIALSTSNPELAEKFFPKQDASDDVQSVLYSFFADYTLDPVAALEKWGLGNELQFSLYSIGFLPAIRIAADGEKFESAMLEAGAANATRTTEIEHKGIDLTLFLAGNASAENLSSGQGSGTSAAETDDSPGSNEDIGLLFAAVGGDVVLALTADANNPEYLDELLGLNDSGQSLKESGKLEKIRQEWNYGNNIAMYFDSQLFADALTGGGNKYALAQMQKLAEVDDNIDEQLELLSTESCRAAITQLASLWPMLVSGVRRFEINDDAVHIDTHLAMVTEHQPLLDLFSLIGGFAPQLDPDSNALFSLGIGIDIDTSPQLVSQLIGLLGGLNYQCALLQPVNQLAKNDLSSAAVGSAMVSGMARGIKGISVSVFADENNSDNTEANPIPYLNSLENMAIAISTEDPGTLLSTLSFLPQFEMLSGLPLDGTPVLVSEIAPVPLPVNNEVFAAVKDKAIVLYSGEEAREVSDTLSGIGDEAFFVSQVNMQYYFESMITALEQFPSQQEGQAEIVENLVTLSESYPDARLSVSLDFTEKGVEFEFGSESKNPE